MEKDLEQNILPTSTLDKRKVWILHGLVFGFICCLSAGVGVATFFGQRAVELAAFQAQFDGNVQQLQNTIQTGLSQKFSASRLVNKLYAYGSAYGYGTTYGQKPPFFTLPGITNYTLEIIKLGGSLRDVNWLPFVDNNTRPAWEAWAKKNIQSQTQGLNLPPSVFTTINATAYRFGICNKTSPTTKARVSGTVLGGDPRFKHWLFPIWQTGTLTEPGVATVIFLEPHAWAGTRFLTIEKILAAGPGGGGAFTDVVQLGSDGANYRPSTNFYSLIYSLPPVPKLIGISNLVLSWDIMLLNALPKSLKRVDCVLTTKTTTSTLAVDQGSVIIVGKGDFHETAMTSYGQSIVLDVSGEHVVSPLAASAYALTVYPSSAFYNQYITRGPIQQGIGVAVAVFFVLSMLYVVRRYYAKQQDRMRGEKDRWEKSQQEAHRAQEDAKKAEIDREREHRLRHELQENIANSAHDIKSPTTALGLAVESLLDTLDNNKPLTVARRHQVVETLHGMAHTISALTMIINRSVDASKGSSSSGRGFFPNNVPVDLEKVMDEIVAFSQWQADGTGIEVVMEPLPVDLPDEIMMDEKWLKDDLLCLAGNAVKYSRSNQGMPAVLRVAIVPAPTEGTSNVPSHLSVQFTFIDSGYPLPDEMLTTIFNRPMHSERMQTGGMGLGLYCLSEHMQALQGRYGARRRSDGREGTEIWFSFPVIVPEADPDQFVMNDVEHGFRNVSMKDANSTTMNAASSKPLFSSPQNRRSSVMRSSQKSQNSSSGKSRASSIRGDRSGYGKGGGIDSSLRGGLDGQTTGSAPKATTASVETDVAVAGGTEHPLRGADHEEALSGARSSVNRIQEVLGTSPILLVDDSVSILKMTKRAIQNECANISFMEAKNGEEAFERVVEAVASFEMIITDIQMPICNGFDFTRRVRQLERDKGLSPKLIIGISANDQPKISEEAKESGMDGFMHKPFKLATLIHVIEDISNRRKQILLQKVNAVVVPVDNDIIKVPKEIGEDIIGIATIGSGSKSGSGDGTISGIKLESLSTPGSGLFAGKKVLVVDDAVSILKLMSHTLKNKAEAIVTQAKDGQQAVDECEKQHFDLILTDIQMPVLDGFGEAKCIRAIEKERGLPRKIIVGISANTQDRMAVDAEEAGMDAFMDKPFKLEELTAVYTKLLERENRNQRNHSTRQPTVLPGVDTDTPSGLGVVARGPRSIRKVTPNAKIFVDASELDDVVASQVVGDSTFLEQNGTAPTAAVAVLESEWIGKVENGTVNGIGMVNGVMSNNAKVHAAN